jgi:hypothetical protein
MKGLVPAEADDVRAPPPTPVEKRTRTTGITQPAAVIAGAALMNGLVPSKAEIERATNWTIEYEKPGHIKRGRFEHHCYWSKGETECDEGGEEEKVLIGLKPPARSEPGLGVATEANELAANTKAAESTLPVFKGKYVKESKQSKKWNTRLEELRQYKQEHGDCEVPQKYPLNQKLANVSTI